MFIQNFTNISKGGFSNKGHFLFLLGVLLLPTALPIAAIFLLTSLFISFSEIKFSFLKDKLNFAILLSIFLIILSSLFNTNFVSSNEFKNVNSYIWLNLFNWIPALLGFIGFQKYLKTNKDRFIFSKYLIAGTIPVIASCLFQLFFNINGPFETLNGLIVWFQKPIENTGGVSGLFSNRNYAGFWLAVNLPFSFFLLKNNMNHAIKRIFLFIITSLIIFLIISTNSRNALLSMLSTIIIYFGMKGIFLVAIFSFLLFFIYVLAPTINLNIIEFLPTTFLRLGGSNFFINSPRVVLYRSVINYILQKPFLGWGSGTFAIIYLARENFWNPPFIFFKPQHSHNLLFEMAFNFGIPLAILITSITFTIMKDCLSIIFSYKYLNEYYKLDKAWVASGIVVLLMHLTDIPFFDGKVSLYISILFSGLRCISLKKNNLELQCKEYI